MRRDQSTAVIENTNTEVMHDFVVPYSSSLKTTTDNNVPMTAANRFSLNEKTVEMVDATDRIIPTPYETIVESDAVSFDITGVLLVNWQSLGVLKNGVSDLLSKLGVSENGDHKVTFVLGALPSEIAGTESYTMEITSVGTTITGADASGLFYGFMSFLGLLDVKNSAKMALKEMTVHDKPRFSYRGHQVDVARNFRSKEAIEKTIDAMALWKVRASLLLVWLVVSFVLAAECLVWSHLRSHPSLPSFLLCFQLNALHLALTNDEGWRLAIPGLDELTSVGSKRCFGECSAVISCR